MPNFLANASNWLDTTLKNSDGVEVTVHVGGDSIETLAVIGDHQLEADDGETGQITWYSVPFLIAAADLVLNGQTFLPEPGMRIVRSVGGRRRTYEVLPDGDRVYRVTDETTLGMLRIRTKLVCDEAI